MRRTKYERGFSGGSSVSGVLVPRQALRRSNDGKLHWCVGDSTVGGGVACIPFFVGCNLSVVQWRKTVIVIDGVVVPVRHRRFRFQWAVLLNSWFRVLVNVNFEFGHAGWLPICGQVPKFCDHVGGAMIPSFAATVLYFIIVLCSFHNVLNLYSLKA
nr:CASP-like protein 1C2 [Ipomoea batatas]